MSFTKDLLFIPRAFAACQRLYSNRSGYRIGNTEPASIIREEHATEEDIWKRKVLSSMLKKQQSRLRGFQRGKLVRKKPVSNPNRNFFHRPKLPQYNSIRRYIRYAEKARDRQREEGVDWKTMDFWLKKQQGEPEYTNIGLSLPSEKVNSAKRRQHLKNLRSDSKLEENTIKRTVELPLDQVMEDWESSKQCILDIYKIAMHYDIYLHLFKDKFFYPVVDMAVGFEDAQDSSLVNPVYYGNEVSPSEAASTPHVMFASNADSLWTLLLVNPDGNLESNTEEYVHWFVGNIRGGDVSTGQTIIDYLCPIPPRGTGYHRMVFVLFKQSQEISYDSEARLQPCISLKDRNFSTSEFYDRHKSTLTPASLRFFQTKWEPFVQKTYQQKLEMPEPVYEYIAPVYDKLGVLRNDVQSKTLTWLEKFMPKEPIFPGGGKFQ